MEYRYPRLSKEWSLFFIKMKLKKVFPVEVEYVSAVEDWVWVAFPRRLTKTEKKRLDELMADVEVGLYPKTMDGFTVFSIDDIYDMWETLEKELDISIRYIFANEPFHDKIEVWVEGTLTPNQIKDFLKAYAKLCKLKHPV